MVVNRFKTKFLIFIMAPRMLVEQVSDVTIWKKKNLSAQLRGAYTAKEHFLAASHKKRKPTIFFLRKRRDMGKAYSLDLREKVMEFLRSGTGFLLLFV